MLSGLPRLAVVLLVLLALTAALLYVAAPQIRMSTACLDGGEALRVGDYDAAAEHFIACIESGELSQAQEADAFAGLGVPDFSSEASFDSEKGLQIDFVLSEDDQDLLITIALLSPPFLRCPGAVCGCRCSFPECVFLAPHLLMLHSNRL